MKEWSDNGIIREGIHAGVLLITKQWQKRMNINTIVIMHPFPQVSDICLTFFLLPRLGFKSNSF
tara:strand:+ start:753 stop:944 length:192 start_codon:yes stop_codon:yes gene_type:complete